MHTKVKAGLVVKHTLSFLLLLLFPALSVADISTLVGTGVKDTNRGAFQVSTSLAPFPKIRLHYTRLSGTNAVSAVYDLKLGRFNLSGGGTYNGKGEQKPAAPPKRL
ncbi:MAG: hypothetical protein BMS9Abin22_475 [Gammaproteobacteria bacterium]|nr:MAG: hypothetical protein BMS9Abin22_475 [Gammaproteobacteria bacterium]